MTLLFDLRANLTELNEQQLLKWLEILTPTKLGSKIDGKRTIIGGIFRELYNQGSKIEINDIKELINQSKKLNINNKKTLNNKNNNTISISYYFVNNKYIF